MGKKEGKGDLKEKKGEGKKEEGGGKKDEGPSPVVLKVDMHCEGCADKIRRAVRRFDGVEGATVDVGANKLTAKGKIDALGLRSYLEAKTSKKVELISPKDPPAKKDKDDGAAKKPADDAKEKKPDDKKPKAPQATTVVLKLRLHCQGCIQRIKKFINKIKGVENVSVDEQKDLVTVKGTMDVKSLPALLKDKFKRSVEIVPAKKDGDGGDKKEKGGGEKKDKDGGGGGEKKDKEGKGDGGKQAAPAEMNKMEYYGGMPYAPPYGYRLEMVHPPQLFSDENPNACSIM